MDYEKIDEIVNEIGELRYAIEAEMKTVKKKMDDIIDGIQFIDSSSKTIENLQWELLKQIGWKPAHERI